MKIKKKQFWPLIPVIILFMLSLSCEKSINLSPENTNFIVSEQIKKRSVEDGLTPSLSDFITKEQKYAFKQSGPLYQNDSSAFSPQFGPRYPLPYFLIPREAISLFNPVLKDNSIQKNLIEQIQVKISGNRHFKFFIHPKIEKEFQFLKSSFIYIDANNTEFLATPTFANNALIVWNRNNGSRSPFIAILQMSSFESETYFIDQIKNSFENPNLETDPFPSMLSLVTTNKNSNKNKNNISIGILIKSIPLELLNGTRIYYTLSELIEDKVLCKLIKNGQLSNFEFIRKYFIDVFLNIMTEAQDFGALAPNFNPANIYFTSQKNFGPPYQLLLKNNNKEELVEKQLADFKNIILYKIFLSLEKSEFSFTNEEKERLKSMIRI